MTHNPPLMNPRVPPIPLESLPLAHLLHLDISITTSQIQHQTATRPLWRREPVLLPSLPITLEIKTIPPPSDLEPSLYTRQIPRLRPKHPPLRTHDLDARQQARERKHRARAPPVRMAEPRIVGVRRVVQAAVDAVPLDKRRIRHARVVEHKVRPHGPHQPGRAPGLPREEVRLQLPSAGKGRDGGTGLWGWRAVEAPAGGEAGGHEGGADGVLSWWRG